MGQLQKRVLLIEDDKDISHLLQLHLKDLGCTCEAVYDGETGLQRALAGGHDLIILDLMLPGLDGIDICKEIRSEQRFTPVLILTSRSEEFDRVLGLELGADDYLTKPFSIRELLARVKAIFRRVDAVKEDIAGATKLRLRSGDLSIDVEKRKVTLGDTAVELTAREFDLLVLFARNPGKAYTRQALLDTVWGYSFEGYDHTVNSHINRLRAKIERDPSHPHYIQTVWGVGYKFTDDE
jgi:DNA-binding response OmpR family regulator